MKQAIQVLDILGEDKLKLHLVNRFFLLFATEKITPIRKCSGPAVRFSAFYKPRTAILG